MREACAGFLFLKKEEYGAKKLSEPHQTPARKYAKGMGKAVADRTVNRRIFNEFKKKTWIKTWVPQKDLDEAVKLWARNNDYEIEKYVIVTNGHDNPVAEVKVLVKGKYETEEWEDVAERVAKGSVSLIPIKDYRLTTYDNDYEGKRVEFEKLNHHLRQASVILSGRHLQHGDETQAGRNQEVFLNCSTAATSFMSFLLLMNGSGVGRCYNDDMMLVDWSYMPNVVTVIDRNHADVQSGEIVVPDFKNAEHLYRHKTRHYFRVPDTREGWAKAIEKMEVMAYQRKYAKDILILDFSDVRPKGAPIMGMQGRPASGPAPLINAINNVARVKYADMRPWLQTMYVDHYLAECVLVGGARRAARLAAKVWTDKNIIEYISIKKGGFLWSANNSVLVDDRFWDLIKAKPMDDIKWFKNLTGITNMSPQGAITYAQAIFNRITEAAYKDGTGEPGIINQHKLTHNDEGLEVYKQNGEFIGSKKYQLELESKELAKNLAAAMLQQERYMITNPCVTGDTWVMTHRGPRQVQQLLHSPFKAVINGKEYNSLNGFWNTGNKPVYKVKTKKGYEFKVTEDHKLLVEVSRKRLQYGYKSEYEKIALKDLVPGDILVINNLRHYSPWGQEVDSEELGWLLGLVVGDGCYNPAEHTGILYLYGEKKELLEKIELILKGAETKYSITFQPEQDRITIRSSYIDWICEEYIESENKTIRENIYIKSSDFYRGFLRGYFDMDGSVQGNREKGISIRLSSINLENLKTVQNMLLRLGIVSSLYETRREAGIRLMPNGLGNLAPYYCQANHELIISKDNINVYEQYVGFELGYHIQRLRDILSESKRQPNKEYFSDEIEIITHLGNEEVYDCTIEDIHLFDANGILVSNCGEIALTAVAGYCCVGDVVPFHAQTVEDAIDACKVAARALMRTNTMDCLYRPEVDRTNRIGVGLTGIHEFAWKFFGYSWKELINEEKSMDFWLTLSTFKRAIVDECNEYAKELEVTVPHTNTTIKPSGTVSKMFGLTEGAHLPAMREYLRWVQFRNDDPLVEQYKSLGYPIKKLQVYAGTTIVGFPTRPEICKLGMGNRLVIASEATMEEQYTWLQLLEKYWIRGVAKDGVTPLPETGNQISYTLKYNPENVSYEQFQTMVRKYQPLVRCCSVMPQQDETAYEYTPESAVTKHEYEKIMQAIKDDEMREDVDLVHVDCSSGACPIDFNKPQQQTQLAV